MPNTRSKLGWKQGAGHCSGSNHTPITVSHSKARHMRQLASYPDTVTATAGGAEQPVAEVFGDSSHVTKERQR